MIKRYFKTLVVLAATWLFAFNATAVDASNPYELANTVASTLINDIQANKDKIADEKVVNEIIERDLMPYIDIKYAAYKVIGTSLKSTSLEDRERFADAFASYMKDSFIKVLSKYTTQELVLAAVKKVESSDKLISVKLFIREQGKQDLELILKFRKNTKTNEWKAFDLIGENISMLDAKVSELSPIIKNSGVDAAIAKLKETSK